MDSYDTFRFVLHVLLILLIVLGSLLTLLVIYVTKQYQTPSGLLIGNLALTDLLVGGVLLPFGIPALLNQGWSSGRHLCVLNGFTNQYLCTVAILTLTAISLDRYVAIIHAMRYHQLMTLKRVRLLIVMVWVFGLLLAIFPLLGWGRYIYEHGASLCVTDFKTDKAFTFFIFVVVFGIPVNVIFFIYSQIFLAVRKQVKAIRTNSIHPANQKTDEVANEIQPIQLANQSNGAPTLNGLTNEGFATNQEAPPKPSLTNQITSFHLSTNQREQKPSKTTLPGTKSLRKKMKNETKAALTMFAIIGVFVLSLTPYTIYSLYCLHTGESYETADFITSKIAYSNAIFNPLIYGLMNKLFRKGFHQVFHMIFRCKKGSVDSEWRFNARSSFSN